VPTRPTNRNSRKWMSAPVLAALLVACDVKAPEYVRPDTPVKDTWQGAAAQPPSAHDTIQPDWWRGFDSAYLDELVNKAIENNVDLRILAARIGVARAGVEQASAVCKPNVQLGAGVDYVDRKRPQISIFSIRRV
jgi:multidrug efflux system outer membrane protein